jgi:hypothetical protein
MGNYAKVNIYGDGGDGQRRLLVGKGSVIPDDLDASVDSGDKAAVRSDAVGVPITGYDNLSESEIVDRLPALSASDLTKVQDYERAGANRSSVITYGSTAGGEIEVLEATVPAVAADADADQVIAEVPRDGKVIEVTYVPEGNVTGDSTESRHLTVVNKAADGNGTTVVASLDFDTGVNATDFNEIAFTRSAVAGATTVEAGDVLAFVSTHEGETGLADPGGRVTVKVA